jgi:hypothetical protein
MRADADAPPRPGHPAVGGCRRDQQVQRLTATAEQRGRGRGAPRHVRQPCNRAGWGTFSNCIPGVSTGTTTALASLAQRPRTSSRSAESEPVARHLARSLRRPRCGPRRVAPRSAAPCAAVPGAGVSFGDLGAQQAVPAQFPQHGLRNLPGEVPRCGPVTDEPVDQCRPSAAGPLRRPASSGDRRWRLVVELAER